MNISAFVRREQHQQSLLFFSTLYPCKNSHCKLQTTEKDSNMKPTHHSSLTVCFLYCFRIIFKTALKRKYGSGFYFTGRRSSLSHVSHCAGAQSHPKMEAVYAT